MAFKSNDGDHGDDAPMAEINIVPMVDVMLVLLIITMITAPFMEHRVNVDLPVAQGQGLQKDTGANEPPVILFVSKDRILHLGNKDIAIRDLPEALATLFKDKPSRELFVRADKDVPYGLVAEVMARVQGAGIQKVGLVTQPE